MFSLDRPRDHDLHTIADFFEILCLVSLDRVSSTDTLDDFIKDHRGRDSFTFREGELEDVLAQIQWRIEALDAWYPFSLERGGKVLQAEDELTNEQVWYVFFLLCGNLPLLTEKNLYQPLTDAFEVASVEVLRSLWPAQGSVEPFGKNTTTFVGEKWERMNALGLLLGGKPDLSEEYFRAGDRGDGGIDIAAWLPLDEHENRNTYSALGQCACSRSDWSRKQSEITNHRLGNTLMSSVPWLEMLFTPILFRNNQGTWAVPGEVARVTLFDRLRILKSIGRLGGIEGFEMPASVGDALEFRLDVV